MSFPILYSKTTTDFSNLGLGILADAIDVKITEELNGAFELDMVYLARGILHEQLVYDAIIKTDTGDQSGQLFRIKKITKTIDKRLNIHAEHVSYVMNDYPVSVSTVVSNATAQTALNAWKSSIESVIGSSSGLTVYSDITTANDAKWTIDTFNNARDVLGGVEGSILDTWGGEFKFDNYRVNLLKQRGTTRDTIIAYGRNLTDLQQDESILETYTSVYPFATVNVKGTKNKADYTVIKTLPEKYVDSSYVNNYPMRRFLAVDFSDKFDDDKNKYSDASLRSLAQKYITSNKIGVPDVSITASVVDLEKAMNGGGSVERIDLGDVVQLNFTDVGINTSVEIVGTIYDVLRERYSEYTLGARKRTFSSIITGQINDVKKSVTRAQSDVISALISADGKSTNYYGSAEPTSPQEGDQWFWQDGPNSGIKQWHDGAWVDLVDTNTQAEIANSVTQAVAQAESMDAELNQSINNSINETMTAVNTSLAALDSEAAVFKSEADSATSSVASSVSALMTTTTASIAAQGSNAVSTANQALATASSVAVSAASANSTANSNATKALSQASSTATSVAAAASIANSNATKAVTSAGTAITNANTALSSAASALSTANTSSLATSSVASDVDGLKASYTSLNSSAGVLTSQTASLAVSASSASAQFDKVSSSTDSLSAETAALKVSASSASAEFTKVNSSAGSLAAETASLKISASSAALSIGSVQSSAGSLASDAASLKVSASSAALSVSNLTSSAGSLSAKTASLAVSASSFATSITSIASDNGSQATSISALTQRADGFDLTVSKVNNLSVGGRNWFLNTASPITIIGSNTFNVTSPISYFSLPTGVTTGSLYDSWGLNSKFVISFDWSITGDTIDGRFIPQFTAAPWGVGGAYTIVSSTNNKGHIVVYGTVTSAWSGTTARRLSLREDNLQGSITISNMKMEQGNVPTAWSPAPEDIDAVTGSLATDTASLKVSASSAALDISHVASSAGSLAADTASLKVSASSAALSISSTQSTASSTATQATSLAVSASSAAVEISNVKSSAGSLSAETSSLKLSASSAALSIGNVQSSAGSLATETAALKVSASSASAEFTKVNSSAGSLATQAASLAVSASSAAIGISNVTSSAGSLATRTASLAVSASSFSTSITSMASQNGSQATAISALTQRADGFDMTVAKVDDITDGIGGRNWLLNTATTRTITGSNNLNYSNSGLYFYLPTGINTGNLYTSWGLNSKFVLSFDWSITGSTISGIFLPQFAGAPWGIGGKNTTVSTTNNKGHVVVYGTVTSAWSGTTARALSFREDNLQGSLAISNIKLEQGTVPTDWTPAPEDVDAQFATQKITIDGITSTVSKQTSDIDAVTNRVQTAEGSISTATNNITGLRSSQTQTANQLQTEITDRTTGDSNTLTQAKSFTTSQITSYDTGIQSQFTQTSNAILASIESTNLVVNSEFDPLNGTWYAFTQTAGSALGTAWSAVASSSFGDWPVVNGSRVVAYSANQWYSTALKPTSAGKAFSASIVVGRASATATTAFDFRIAFWDSSKKLISNLGSTNPVNGSSYVAVAKYVTENITSPTGTAYVSLVIAHSSGNAQDFISRPMLNYGAKAASYSPTYGTTSSSTVLSLMKDNYSFGINANGQLVSGISGNEELLTLTGKAIHLDGETTVSGDFYALGGNFKNLNASEIKTGTINASLINVINLNANNITTGALKAELLSGITGYLKQVSTGNIYNTVDSQLQISAKGMYDTTHNSGQLTLWSNNSSYDDLQKGSMQYWDNTMPYGSRDGLRFKGRAIQATSEGSGANLYLSPYNNGEVRAVLRGTLDSYADIHGQKVTSGNIMLNGYHSIVSSDGGKMYITDGTNNIDLGVKTLTQSSLVSLKENIRNVEPLYALEEVLKADIRQYNFIGDDVTNTHITPMIDNVNHRLYIPNDWVSDDGESVDTYTIIGYLIQSVKELNNKITELENTNGTTTS